jgi:hypothetical protein
MLVIGGYDLISTKSAELTESVKQFITINFDTRENILRLNFLSNAVENTESRDKDCVARKAYDPYKHINAMAALDGLKARVFEEIEYLSLRPVKLWLAGFTAQAVSLLFLAIPLFIALWLSFNITLWILSKVTESKVRLVLIVFLDVVVALVMPPLLTSAMLLSAFLIMVFGIGNIIDFTTLQNSNWMTVGISGASVMLHAMYFVPLGFAYALFLLPAIASVLIAPIAITIVLYMAYVNLHAFILDTVRFLSLDFDETVQQALINYAIAIDLLFSFTYLLPCIALVTAHRSERTRRAFLSITQWIAENPNGILPAIAKILRGIADVLDQFFRRKKD